MSTDHRNIERPYRPVRIGGPGLHSVLARLRVVAEQTAVEVQAVCGICSDSHVVQVGERDGYALYDTCVCMRSSGPQAAPVAPASRLSELKAKSRRLKGE